MITKYHMYLRPNAGDRADLSAILPGVLFVVESYLPYQSSTHLGAALAGKSVRTLQYDNMDATVETPSVPPAMRIHSSRSCIGTFMCMRQVLLNTSARVPVAPSLPFSSPTPIRKCTQNFHPAPPSSLVTSAAEGQAN